MAGLTRYKNSSYFNQYAVLQYVNIDGKYVTSQIIYPVSKKSKRFKNHNDFVIHLSAIKDAVEYFINNIDDGGKHIPKFVIYLDKESYYSHPVFQNKYYTDYIDFRIYNEIVPGYTTCVKDLSISTFDKQLESALHEIIYYVDKVGLGNYIDKIVVKDDNGEDKEQNVSFAYTARRFLEKDGEFKNIVKDVARYNVRGSRFPSYKFVREVVPNIKEFNANKLVCHGKKVRWEKVCKYDINSSFWAVPLTEYTGIHPKKIEVDEYGLTKKGETLSDIVFEPNNIYFCKIRINNLLITKEKRFDWLGLFDIDLTSKSMWVSNVEVNDILDTYELTEDDFIIEEVYLLKKVPFTDGQRKFYQTLHKRKALAKQNGDNLLKMCLKVIGHSLHGYAIGNWFTEIDNEKTYLNIATLSRAATNKTNDEKHNYEDKHYANHLLTPIDSMFFYSHARSHLLKVLELFGDNFYYDTDSIVTAKNDTALAEYNKWIDSKYEAMGLTPKEYTHNGHTIGYLELEEECDNFCHLSPKFYLWVNDGNLHSTTAGYAKNSVAQKIEEVSGLKGTDALKWFTEQKYIELDLGYISDGEKYIKNIFKYENKKSDYV